MAGTLPGVQAARRRRFQQKSNVSHGPDNHFSPAMSGYGGTTSRRPSFCLYAANHEFRLCSNLRNPMSQVAWDESRLGAEAREAKKRLDERLQPQWRSEAKSNIRPALQADLQAAESPKLNRKGSKRLTWLKLRWKTSEQEECPVCLEQLMRPPLPKTLMQLGCGHKFHTSCLVRWLESKPHCPCCRMEIAS